MWPSICIYLLSIPNNDNIVVSSSISKLLSCLRSIFSTQSNIFWWYDLSDEVWLDPDSRANYILIPGQNNFLTPIFAADHICHCLALLLLGRLGFRGLCGDNMFVRADAAIFQRYSNPASALAAACLLVCWRPLFPLSGLKCWFKHRRLQVIHVLIWIGFESLSHKNWS